jgi:hypothetical protein
MSHNSIPAREAAEAEAAKRERHKPKTLRHKSWQAVHDPIKGWRAALVDVPAYAEAAARSLAREALLRGDMVSFQKHAADALMARCAAEIAAASGTEARRAETPQSGSVHDGPVPPQAADAPTPPNEHTKGDH